MLGQILNIGEQELKQLEGKINDVEMCEVGILMELDMQRRKTVRKDIKLQ